MNRTFVERYKLVQGIQPRTTNGGFSADWVSLRNANRVAVVVNLTQAVGHATAFTLAQATTVAGGDTKAITNNCLIWANEDCATSDTLVRKADAKAYTVAADVKNKVIVFEVDPSNLDVANNFDCISLTVADSSQATNIASVEFYIDSKYVEEPKASAITD
jgi:hypothetical protein